MTAIKVKLDGADKAKRAFRKKLAEYQQEVERIVGDAADAVRDDARSQAPVETGRLRRSIEARQDGTEAEVAIFDKRAFYGRWVEFGTSRRKARPFMQPSAESERKRLPDRIREAIR